MIIKSMARKTPSFGQLINYMSDIQKSDEQFNVYQNIFSHKTEDIEQEFMQNSQYIPRRKNGNYMYHEILSITKAQKLDLNDQKQTLRNLAYEYSRLRAQDNLVFGTLHDDHDEHLHYHLLISANAYADSKKTRLSKAQFDKLKKEFESQVLQNHPELEQKLVINREAEEKLSRKGSEQKRRTTKTPQRDAVKSKLENIFTNSKSKEAFFSSLNEAGLEFYARGKTIGIKDLSTNRKHRIKTLGLMDAFNELSTRIELENAQQDKKESAEIKTDSQTNEATPEKPQKTNQQQTEQESKTSATDKQQAKRAKEMEEIRKQQSNNDQDANKQNK